MIPEDGGGGSLDSRDAHSNLEPAEHVGAAIAQTRLCIRAISTGTSLLARKVVTWLRPTFWTDLSPLDRCARMNV